MTHGLILPIIERHRQEDSDGINWKNFSSWTCQEYRVVCVTSAEQGSWSFAQESTNMRNNRYVLVTFLAVVGMLGLLAVVGTLCLLIYTSTSMTKGTQATDVPAF